jgi:hypothetical protein
MENKLKTPDETKNYLDGRKMKLNESYFIEQTENAVKIYNEFVKDKKAVGALIHSTC